MLLKNFLHLAPLLRKGVAYLILGGGGHAPMVTHIMVTTDGNIATR